MNNKVYRYIVTALVCILLILLNTGYIKGFAARIKGHSPVVIVIDPGHGGKDGGASGITGTIEKTINLSISQKLQGYVEGNGGICIMTRETDDGLYADSNGKWAKGADLKKRREIITGSKGDIFVSIHLNSFPQHQYYGAQVFYEAGNEQSKLLADNVQKQLADILDPQNMRVAKAADSYYILNGNPMPSVIVECGFISNAREEKLLQDESYQNKVAYAIYTGILKYIESGK